MKRNLMIDIHCDGPNLGPSCCRRRIHSFHAGTRRWIRTLSNHTDRLYVWLLGYSKNKGPHLHGSLAEQILLIWNFAQNLMSLTLKRHFIQKSKMSDKLIFGCATEFHYFLKGELFWLSRTFQVTLNLSSFRLICDQTMEKKIYDRQISKQGMSGKFPFSLAKSLSCFIDLSYSDRVVDELNPVQSLERQDITKLLIYDDSELPCPSSEECEENCNDETLSETLKVSDLSVLSGSETLILR